MSTPTSIEDKLKAMREGYSTSLEITYGSLKIPVRVMTATEEGKLLSEAKLAALKATIDFKDPLHKQQTESLEVMKHILNHGTTIGSTQMLPRELLDQLSSTELTVLYDEYYAKCEEVDPKFTNLSPSEIEQIIIEVKKSPDALKGLSTRQLKGIGLHFLEKILPMVSVLGG